MFDFLLSARHFESCLTYSYDICKKYCAHCRTQRALSNEPFGIQIGVNTARKERPKLVASATWPQPQQLNMLCRQQPDTEDQVLQSSREIRVIGRDVLTNEGNVLILPRGERSPALRSP